MEQTLTGLGLVAAERNAHVTREGWTPELDDKHTRGQLAEAGACYAISATDITNHPNENRRHVPTAWPWAKEFWKPTSPLRMLVKAGALIVAEIDRRLRAGETP